MPRPETETPHPSELGGEKGTRGERTATDVKQRLRRQHTAKSHTAALVGAIGAPKSKELGIRFDRVMACGDWTKYRDYYTGPGWKLYSANFCKNSLVCSLCAGRRASRAMAKYLEKFQTLQAESPELKPYLVTLTVRNQSHLGPALRHLQASLKLLHHRRMEKKSKSLMRDIAGGVFSIEVTNTGKEWHPHVHAIWLAAERPDMFALRAEWEQITGDSFMCDVRPIAKETDNGPDIDPHAGGFAEVFKYAMKPSELGPKRMIEAYPILKGRRLMGAFGAFRGVPESSELHDDLTGLDDLPYFEYLFRYTHAGYKFYVS